MYACYQIAIVLIRRAAQQDEREAAMLALRTQIEAARVEVAPPPPPPPRPVSAVDDDVRRFES
jgi:hypothetical protein